MSKVYSTLTLAAALLFSSVAYSQETPKLTDAEIAHVGVVANQIDVDYAAIALKRSKNKSVIDFAEAMTRDHKAVIKKATDLVTKLGVTPKDNSVSQSLLDDAKKTKKSLEDQSKTSFDKAYIDNEVAYHKAVINAVEKVLIPQATNAELKSLLEAIVPSFKAHLAHAEMTQKELKDLKDSKY